MSSADDSNISNQQAAAIANKAARWRAYLKRRRAAILRSNFRDRLFNESSFWYSVFAYINWLARFYYFEFKPQEININKVAHFLYLSAGWHIKYAKAFWKACRHPIVHSGQTNVFNAHNIDGEVIYPYLDINKFSKATEPDLERAKVLTHPTEQGAFLLLFHYQPIAKDLEKIAEFVVSHIGGLNDRDKIQRVVEINQEIPH